MNIYFFYMFAHVSVCVSEIRERKREIIHVFVQRRSEWDDCLLCAPFNTMSYIEYIL